MIDEEVEAGFQIHDAVELIDSELAAELDEAGYAQNDKMCKIIRAGLYILTQAEYGET